ncbi:MAG: hypothetical protein GKR94_26115 [Gammaproteobacteria bacterium]|nr:hypothetical protein [Gammaproteobacteria bacterium]
MTWAQRLQRVFPATGIEYIDIETGERCGAKVEMMASIEDRAVNNKSLTSSRPRPLQGQSHNQRTQGVEAVEKPKTIILLSS